MKMHNKNGLLLPSSTKNPLDKYRTEHHTSIDNNDFSGGCYSSFDVLPILVGTKVDMITISLLKALGARSVRIHTGCVTCDACSGRASVWVDENDIIKEVSMELSIPNAKVYGPQGMNGSEVDARLKELRNE